MTNNINKYKGTLLVMGSIFIGSCAQLVLKFGLNMLPNNVTSVMPVPWDSIIWVLFGLAGYAISMLIWMMALSNYELSFAYPLLSLSYILVYLGAVLVPQLNETVSISKTIGILLIVIGVVFVTKSKHAN